MTYLNNAATSHPKPQCVVDAMTAALRNAPASALRSTAADDFSLTRLRKRLGELLHTADHERIFFTSGATDALNRLIGGLDMAFLTTTDNHNSVLRPLFNMRKSASVVEPRQLTSSSEGNSNVLIVPHCSNVTGEIHDLKAICQWAHEQGMMVMVDAAQSAGCIPIDVEGWGVDMLVFTGHKALFGPQGTGGFFVRRGIDLHPTVFGGTGRDSSIIEYDDGDWEYEVGTPNGPGLAGLAAGVDYVLDTGVDNIYRKGQAQANRLIGALKSNRHIDVYGDGGTRQGPVVSFNIHGLLPSDVGYMLQNAYDITVRTGLHCSPLAHQTLHTTPWGTVRASMSYHTTDSDLQALMEALGDITKSL